jgi:hypothetical protein
MALLSVTCRTRFSTFVCGCVIQLSVTGQQGKVAHEQRKRGVGTAGCSWGAGAGCAGTALVRSSLSIGWSAAWSRVRMFEQRGSLANPDMEKYTRGEIEGRVCVCVWGGGRARARTHVRTHAPFETCPILPNANLALSTDHGLWSRSGSSSGLPFDRTPY